MNKTILKLSVILVILPFSFGNSGKTGCNKSKQKSDNKTEIKSDEREQNINDSKINENINCSFRVV